MTESPQTDAAAAGHDVGLRAGRAVALVAGRGFVLRIISFLSVIVLVRFLTPRDFGMLAIGTTAVGLSNFLNDGGVGAALLRRSKPPTHTELRGSVTIQFGITSAIFLVALLVAVVTRSTVAGVTAIMLLALPIGSLQIPGSVLLEREMTYGPLVKVDFAQAFVYSTAAIGSVALGVGVWGVAVATVLSLAPGIAILWIAVPGAVALPGRGVAEVRPLLRLGLQFQAAAVVTVIRDEGLNLLVLALGGLGALGLWSIAERVLLAVVVVLESLWRVSFPAMARMLETKSDPSRAIGRTASAVAFGLGVVLVPIATLGPEGVSLLFGNAWRHSADVLPPACLGYAILAPVSTACAGYLYARGEAGKVLASVTAHTVASLATVALLLPSAGLAAVGYGLVVTGIVDFVLLGRATRRTIDAPLVGPTVALVATGSLAAAVGVAAGGAAGPGVAGVVVATASGLVTYGVLASAANRWVLEASLRLDLRELVGRFLSR